MGRREGEKKQHSVRDKEVVAPPRNKVRDEAEEEEEGAGALRRRVGHRRLVRGRAGTFPLHR